MPAPRRILLTGAGGFVGGHLRAALAAAWPDAAVLAEPFELRDGAAVAAAVAVGKPDACVHLAAVSTPAAAREDEARAWDVNLHGTLRLARAILLHAPECRLLFVSSADAYGGGAGTPIGEDVKLAPRNLYAATKAAADLALGSMVGQGLRVVRLRPFNHTGPGQSADLAIPAFARQIARIEAGLQPPVLEVGNLDPLRDFLDVRDVCAAYVACIERWEALAAGRHPQHRLGRAAADRRHPGRVAGAGRGDGRGAHRAGADPRAGGGARRRRCRAGAGAARLGAAPSLVADAA